MGSSRFVDNFSNPNTIIQDKFVPKIKSVVFRQKIRKGCMYKRDQHTILTDIHTTKHGVYKNHNNVNTQGTH